MNQQPATPPPDSGDSEYEKPQLWILVAVGGFMVVTAILIVIFLVFFG